MDAVVQQVGDKVVFIDAQLESSDYGSTSGDVVGNTTIYDFTDPDYVPSFWMIDEVVGNSSFGSESQAVSYATNAYDALAAEGVTANIAFEFEITRDVLTVNTLTKFFKQTSGDYYVNIMLLESDFQVNQSGAGLIDAQRVLRVLFSGENGAGDEKFWDAQIGSGDIAAGTEVAKTFSTTLNSSWDQDNFTVVPTIWYKSGSTIKAISTEDVPGDVTPISNDAIKLSEQSKFFMNSKGKTGVTFFNRKEGNVQLYIYDMAGRIMAKSVDRWLKSGCHTITANTSNLAAGIYNYRLITPERVLTKKMIISPGNQ